MRAHVRVALLALVALFGGQQAHAAPGIISAGAGLSLPHAPAKLGTFAPSDVSGLVLDVNPDTGVTLNGANISALADQSPTGAILAQGTVANQPLLSTNAVNGHNAIAPNDANDRIDDAAKPDLSNLAGYTSFVVFELTASTELLTRTAEASASIADAMQSDTVSIIRFVGGGTQTGKYPFASTAAYHISEALFDGSQVGNTGRLKLYHDGTAQTVTYAGTIPATTGAGCAGYQVGHSAAAGGKVARVLIYSRALSASERSAIGQYLASTYGITSTY